MTEPSQSGALTARILRGLFVLVFFGLFWKLGGFLMSVLMAGLYGPGSTSDAYTSIFSVILFTFLYSSLLKVVVPALMPLFAEERQAHGEEAAWRLVNTLLNLVLVAGAVAVFAGMVFPGRLISTLLPGFSGATHLTAVRMLRGMLPGVWVMFFAVMALAILNSYKVFSYPSAADAVQKLAWAVVLFVLARGVGVDLEKAPERPVYLGFLAGAAAQLAVLLFGLRGKARLYVARLPALSTARLLRELALLAGFVAAFAGWTLLAFRTLGADRREDARFLTLCGAAVLGFLYALWLWARAKGRGGIMARFAVLAAPLFIGVVFARFRDLSTAFFQSYTLTGVFGAMEYAKKVGNLPVILLAYSLSIAMFPYLCDLAARKDMRTFSRLLTDTVHSIALLAVPVSVGIVVLSRPIMEVVFDRGNWTDEMLLYGALGLAIFASGLLFYALENVIMQSYFSLKRMWTPTVLGIAATLLHAGFLYAFIRGLRYDSPAEIFAVVALSFPLSRAAKNLALMALLRRRVAYLPPGRTGIFLLKLLVVSLGVGMAAAYTLGPVRRAFPLAPLRGREVMTDTFNPEPRGWCSHDAFSLTVGRKPPPAFRRVLEGGFLEAEYRWRPERRFALYRDLRDFDLGGARAVVLRIAASAEGAARALRYALVLQERDGARFEAVLEGAGEHEVAFEDFSPVERSGVARQGPVGEEVVRLVIEDRNRLPRRTPVRLRVDALRFRRGGDRAPVSVDPFEPLPEAWAVRRGPGVRVERLGESDAPEYALRLEGGAAAERSLSDYDLGAATVLTFKAAAAQESRLAIRLRTDGGRIVSHQVTLARTQERKRYAVALDGAVSAAEILSVENLEGEGGPVWLDNIAFVRPAHRLGYEATKLLILAVPTCAGLLAFVLLCWALRVEEALAAVAWIRRRGWRDRGKVGAAGPEADQAGASGGEGNGP